jgi:hypothetical protein
MFNWDQVWTCTLERVLCWCLLVITFLSFRAPPIHRGLIDTDGWIDR